MGIQRLSLNTKRALIGLAAAAFAATLLAVPATVGAVPPPKGSIKVNKAIDKDGDGDYTYGFVGNLVANNLGFRWGLNQETPGRHMGGTASNLNLGTYTVTEKMVPNYKFVGWYSGEGSCSEPEHRTYPVSVTLTPQYKDQEITLCNKLQPTITVTKQTNPDGDLTPFSITVHTANGKVHGGATRDIHDDEKEVYEVGFGTYTVVENVPAGWTETSNTCKDLVVNKDHPAATCEIVNTKNPVVGGQGSGVVQGVQTAVPQVAAPTGGVGAGSGSSVTSLGALLGLVGSLGVAGLGLRQVRKT